jgi:hypothetical protein
MVESTATMASFTISVVSRNCSGESSLDSCGMEVVAA